MSEIIFCLTSSLPVWPLLLALLCLLLQLLALQQLPGLQWLPLHHPI